MFIQDNFVSKAQGYSNKKLILDVQVYRYLNNFRSNSAQRKMPFSTPAEHVIVVYHYKQSLTYTKVHCNSLQALFWKEWITFPHYVMYGHDVAEERY